MFVNGVEGDGVHGFQSEVFTSTPDQDDYSPLKSHVHVIWNDNMTPTVLSSEDDIIDHAASAAHYKFVCAASSLYHPDFNM